MPFGLKATDRFIDALRTRSPAPRAGGDSYERGQLVDLISDMHQYFYGKKVALVGDPDQFIAMTEFLVSIDMQPIHIVTGTPGKSFEERIKESPSRWADKVNVRAKGRHVPPASVDQERAGRSAHRQHLLQVYRPRRGHPLWCAGASPSSTARAISTSRRSATRAACGSWRRSSMPCSTARTAF
jgi:hypothetical protein